MEPWILQSDVYHLCCNCGKKAPLCECVFVPQPLCKECYEEELKALPKSNVTYEITSITDGVSFKIKDKED